MGSCFAKPKKLVEIVPSNYTKSLPVVRLSGSPSGIQTSHIRIALSYKNVTLHFITSENPNFGSDTPVLQFGSDIVTGCSETLLRYIDENFPNPPLLDRVGHVENQAESAIVLAAVLQHKSMTWHLEGLVKLVEDLATRGTGMVIDPSMGSPRMEVRKLGRRYTQLLEMMLEHAQLEERVIFPALERADRGLTKVANEEHARDLPIMNGIKEDIKSIGVIEAGSYVYQEALLNVSSRLKILQEHCKEHFKKEEKELLPLLELEAIEPSEVGQESMMKQCLEMMEATHSHLFHFMIEGLIPRDAMKYLNIIIRYSDEDRVVRMLCSLTNNRNEVTMS